MESDLSSRGSRPRGRRNAKACVFYDAVNGSLRLTQRLWEGFADVISLAKQLAKNEGSFQVADEFGTLLARVNDLSTVDVATGASGVFTADEHWVTVVAPGEKAIYASQDGPIEVEVISFRYTPKGLMYNLVPLGAGGRWTVVASAIQPIHGMTKTQEFNLVTGETR